VIREWIRHLFRDRIGPASTAPLLSDLLRDPPDPGQDAPDTPWHSGHSPKRNREG
jgi:hypothetical protein